MTSTATSPLRALETRISNFNFWWWLSALHLGAVLRSLPCACLPRAGESFSFPAFPPPFFFAPGQGPSSSPQPYPRLASQRIMPPPLFRAGPRCQVNLSIFAQSPRDHGSVPGEEPAAPPRLPLASGGLGQRDGQVCVGSGPAPVIKLGLIAAYLCFPLTGCCARGQPSRAVPATANRADTALLVSPLL